MTALPATRETPWGRNRSAPAEVDRDEPTSCDALIVGAGANGLMTAWHLARAGLRVVVCEKGEVAAEASSRAFGWISGLLLDPSKMELSKQGLELWQGAQDVIGDLGYRTTGLCYFADSMAEMGHFEQWRDQIRASRYSGIELLGPEDLRRKFPGMSRSWKGGIWSRNEGGIEPKLATAALARGVREAGGRIYERCAVRGFERSAGRLSAVITEHGRITTSQVVVAANIWTRLLLGNHGVDVPQLYVILSMGCTNAVPDGPDGCGGQEHWAWRRQIDGGYSLGRLRGQRIPITRDSIQLFSKFVPMMRFESHNLHKSVGREAWQDLSWPRRWALDRETVFERVRIYDPRVNKSCPETSLQLNGECFPALARASITETWAGAVAVTPDNVAIAGAIPEIPGLYLITGCAYGLTWAPGLGRMVSEQILGRPQSLDPAPFRLGRFFDGSLIVVRA